MGPTIGLRESAPAGRRRASPPDGARVPLRRRAGGSDPQMSTSALLELGADPDRPRPAAAPPGPPAEPPEVSVVMPCLNEARTLAPCIGRALAAFEEHGIRGEVVVADNGSTDGSAEVARACGARVVAVASRGYGSALMGGVAAAKGRYVIMGDADESYDFGHVPRFLEKLREGNDLVMGNRFRGGIAPGAMPALHQYFGNPLLTALARCFFRSPVGDIYCGLRGFPAASHRALKLRTTGMEYACEMVIKATLQGQRIAEVPTTLSPDGRDRPPHLRSFRDGWRTLRFMLLYSPRWLFLYPGIALMILGALMFMGPLMGARGAIGAGTLRLLLTASAMVLLGFQAANFAVFSKIFALASGLHPPRRFYDRVFEVFTLEAGLAIGAAVLGAGCAGAAYATWAWQPADGALSALRLALPSVVAVILGFQMILSSFLLSLAGLSRT